MPDDVFEAVRAAVQIAKDRQIRSLKNLESILLREGFAADAVKQAIQFWADYEGSKQRLAA
jgi:hypothetical protein